MVSLDVSVRTIISLFDFVSVYSTIFIGWRRTLTFDDIWAIREEDSSSNIMPTFEQNWRREKAKVSLTKVAKYVRLFSASQ